MDEKICAKIALLLKDITQVNRTVTVEAELKVYHIKLVCEPWVRAEDGTLSMETTIYWFDVAGGSYRGRYTLNALGPYGQDTNACAREILTSISLDHGLKYWNMMRDKMLGGGVLPILPPY